MSTGITAEDQGQSRFSPPLAATIRYAPDLHPPVVSGSALYRREAIGYRQLQFEIAEP
jgi:hypothetical protein